MDGEERKSDEAAPKRDKPLEERDLVFVQGRSETGDGFRVIRSRTGQIEVGELRSLRAGQPIHGEVVSLAPIDDHKQLFEVDVLVDTPDHEDRPGPARVSNNAYRRNWDAIFGAAPEGELN